MRGSYARMTICSWRAADTESACDLDVAREESLCGRVFDLFGFLDYMRSLLCDPSRIRVEPRAASVFDPYIVPSFREGGCLIITLNQTASAVNSGHVKFA
jgi:hypothetical protein